MLEKIRQFFAALLGEEVKTQPIVTEPEAPTPKPKKAASSKSSKKKRSPSKKAK